jgi:hypothetical protein
MKIAIVAVGKAKGAVGEAIGEYEPARGAISSSRTPSLCDRAEAAKFECPSLLSGDDDVAGDYR